MIDITATTTLYRPVGPQELELIRASGYRRFPPRLPEQPIFYPVTNEAYAVQISKEWNVPAYGSGFVTEFDLPTEYLQQYPVQNVGGTIHNELWVPAEELDAFNDQIIGEIRITQSFYSE